MRKRNSYQEREERLNGMSRRELLEEFELCQRKKRGRSESTDNCDHRLLLMFDYNSHCVLLLLLLLRTSRTL